MRPNVLYENEDAHCKATQNDWVLNNTVTILIRTKTLSPVEPIWVKYPSEISKLKIENTMF